MCSGHVGTDMETHCCLASQVPSAAAKGSNSKFVWELSLRPTTQHNPNGIRRDYHAQAKPYRRMTNDTAPKRDVKTPTDATYV